MYEFKNVRYKNILDIDHLKIRDGKVTFISGQSGSGKSTLLKLLNKMISADEGEILYRGEDIKNIDSIKLRREVVMLNQSPAIYEGNIRDNLLIGRKFAKTHEIDDSSLEKALKDVYLDKSLDDSPNNLSGGEAQRLAIARIMVMDFKTLILDEPSSALDNKNETEILATIVNFIKERKLSLIIVSHSKSLIEKYAEDIVYVDNGKIVKEQSFEK